MSSWSCSATRWASWSASLIAEFGTGRLTVRCWLLSAGCSPGNGGRLSSSRRRRCCAGTERPDGTNGEHGDANEARGAQG